MFKKRKPGMALESSTGQVETGGSLGLAGLDKSASSRPVTDEVDSSVLRNDTQG